MAGRHRKIDLNQLDVMLNQDGLSHKECAEKIGVTLSAIYQAAKRTKTVIGNNIVQYQANQIVTRNINAVDQLHNINCTSNNLLDELVRTKKEDSAFFDSVVNINDNLTEEEVDKYLVQVKARSARLKINTDHILKTVAEIRNQLKLQLEIFQCLYDMESVKKFQDEVVKIINEVDEDAGNRIVRRLQSASAIRKSIEQSQ